MGHLDYITDVWITINGKHMRGSFKVKEDKVYYFFGWKCNNEEIRSVERKYCSFTKFSKFVSFARQGESDIHTFRYELIVTKPKP